MQVPSTIHLFFTHQTSNPLLTFRSTYHRNLQPGCTSTSLISFIRIQVLSIIENLLSSIRWDCCSGSRSWWIQREGIFARRSRWKPGNRRGFSGAWWRLGTSRRSRSLILCGFRGLIGWADPFQECLFSQFTCCRPRRCSARYSCRSSSLCFSCSTPISHTAPSCCSWTLPASRAWFNWRPCSATPASWTSHLRSSSCPETHWPPDLSSFPSSSLYPPTSCWTYMWMLHPMNTRLAYINSQAHLFLSW